MQMQPYLAVGQVLKPQGLRGEVKVMPMTDDPQRFWALQQVLLRKGDAYSPCAVRCVRVHNGFAYLLFDGIADCDAAEALRGELLFVDRAHAAPLPDDADFIADLLGCEVCDTCGQRVGTLKDVLQPGANDVYVVDTPRGEMLIPALKRVVPHVDAAARRITVDEGLLDEVAVRNE